MTKMFSTSAREDVLDLVVQTTGKGFDAANVIRPTGPFGRATGGVEYSSFDAVNTYELKVG